MQQFGVQSANPVLSTVLHVVISRVRPCCSAWSQIAQRQRLNTVCAACYVSGLSTQALLFCLVSGRSETEIEYSVGFDSNGVISALDCKAWCLAGAFMDLAWNDLYGVMTGLDMVTARTFTALHLSKCKLCTFVAVSIVILLEQ